MQDFAYLAETIMMQDLSNEDDYLYLFLAFIFPFLFVFGGEGWGRGGQ